MRVSLSYLDEAHRRAFHGVNGILCLEEAEDGVPLYAQPGEGVEIRRTSDGWCIRCDALCRFTRGLGLVAEHSEEPEGFVLGETPAFSRLGAMIDCSRNAVPNRQAVERLLAHLALMGYTDVQLYTEDTYELKEYPYFGYLRGRYSLEELRWMDDAAAAVGIELIPCIQTLAHLGHALKWSEFADMWDIDDILLVGEEKTYQLIDAMFSHIAAAFRSRRINIGMDEAHLLGLGNYLHRHGYADRFAVMQSHLERVKEIAQGYGFQVMMWSDMYFRLAMQGEYYGTDVTLDDKVKESIPTDVSLIYWDYYSDDPARYDQMLERHLELDRPVAFAGGAWKWHGYTPSNRISMDMADVALEACKKHGIAHVIVTAWGDNGAEASLFSVLPTFAYWAESCYRPDPNRELAARFAAVTGESLSQFLMLDEPLFTPDNPSPGEMGLDPPKYYLYQDILLGLADSTGADTTYAQHFQACQTALEQAAACSPRYAALFAEQAALCRVLKEKVTAGKEIRRAYRAGDRRCLSDYAAARLPRIADEIAQFHRCVRTRWLAENKAFGLEVLDLRLGGLKTRVLLAAERLGDYLEGRVDRLEELEEEVLPYGLRTFPGNPLSCVHWEDIATPAGVVGF